MAISNVVPFRRAPDQNGLTREICLEAAERIRQAAKERISHLQAEVRFNIDAAIEASEMIAATMIDHAIETNLQVSNVDERFGVAVQYWERLASLEDAQSFG